MLPDKDAFDYFIRGEFHYQQGRDEEALKSYSQALRRQPDHFLSLLASGLTLLKTGQYRSAEAALNRAIALNPDIVLSQRMFSPMFMEQKRPDSITVSPDSALTSSAAVSRAATNGMNSKRRLPTSIVPSNSDRILHLAYYNRGVAHYRAGDSESGPARLDGGRRVRARSQRSIQ